jgi:hypothetical protein
LRPQSDRPKPRQPDLVAGSQMLISPAACARTSTSGWLWSVEDRGHRRLESPLEDFIGAVRTDDKDHGSYPSLTDGLRAEEVIVATRRSSITGRWSTAGDEGAFEVGQKDRTAEGRPADTSQGQCHDRRIGHRCGAV